MEADQKQLDEATPHTINSADGETRMNRREALAIVGKHAVYAAPAVLAILAATKSNTAYAVDSCTDPRGC
ncbi:MAG: hypothetical protein ABTR92_01940 [Candidatus Accumulibacter phosphatis]|uniref:hypothetical protein n=1 Tax=Candidatus Accumulibacter sp. ACC012 TaxID=2823332 RepID=UPI0025C37F59|nr:hypothetical protein [Candidatus Accumulibacter sp. ACC012]